MDTRPQWRAAASPARPHALFAVRLLSVVLGSQPARQAKALLLRHSLPDLHNDPVKVMCTSEGRDGCNSSHTGAAHTVSTCQFQHPAWSCDPSASHRLAGLPPVLPRQATVFVTSSLTALSPSGLFLPVLVSLLAARFPAGLGPRALTLQASS